MLRLLWLGCLGALVGSAAALTGSGLLLEGPQPPLEHADAIIVISGDESQARLREGIRLYRAGWAPTLIVSGAADDGVLSNASAMEMTALQAGVPSSAILPEPEAMDTFGNAVYTRRLMVERGMKTAILVTSPYHLHRATITFQSVYRGTGVRIIPRSAPDSAWRKVGWWNGHETRRLTFRELERIGYIMITGRFN
ncbi:MAG: YdcF family protein [Chloroflexota bacterium]